MAENRNGDGCDATTVGPSQDVDAAAVHAESATTPVVAPRASSLYFIMNHTFRVDPRYSALKPLGKGSFGFVCSAADEKQAKRVAIKKIHPMARHALDAKHVLREIRLMRYLGVHPNIISLEDLFVSENHDELYIVMELLDSDLHRIIQSSQALGDSHHRYFMYQLLKGVKFLHDNRIIHRDLKPGNLLVTKSCQLRIIDFGLARLRPMGRGADPDDEVDHPMTEHVVTRWYRPPELMLCPDGLYGYAVDLWSVGCILAELLGRQPLFPGKDFVEQLALIFDVVGAPEEHEVAHIRNQNAKRFLESMRDRVKVPFADLFPTASDPAVNLLERLLVFHPPSRMTVDEALEHPYFQPLRGNDHSPELEVAQGLEFDFESEPLCRLELKKMILQEVDSFRRAQLKRDSQALGGAVLAGVTSVSNAKAVSSALPTTARGVVPAKAPGDRRHAAGDAAGSDSNEEQRHLRRQRLRRRQAELSTVTAAAAAAAPVTATASAAGASAAGAGDSTVVPADGRERPPIAALPSSNQTANEAGKARASQSSNRHMRVPSSHWGPAVAVAAAAAAAVTAAAAAAAAAAPPPRDDPNPVRAIDKSPADELHKTSSTTAPMDDEEAKTPPPEAAQGAPIRPPPTPEYQMRHCGVQWAGGGDDVRWAAGRQMMTSDHHWCCPERATGGGLGGGGGGGGGMHELNFNGRFPLPQPYPRAGQELDRYHIPLHASSAWAPLSNAVGPALGAAVGPAVGLCDSPERVRRSTASGAMGPGGRFQGGVDGNAVHGLMDVRGTSRPDGRGYHASRSGRDRVVYLYQQEQLQQQLQPQPQPQPWSRTSLNMHDVQDRFHRLNFERARNGHGPSEAPVGSGMRAPQR